MSGAQRPGARLLRLFCTVWLTLAALPLEAASGGQSQEGQSWAEQKCALYQRAVTDALDFLGPEGFRPEFLARNEAFIAGGCAGRGNVCPQTGKELEFANLLTLMTMNEGMASSFVPFGCRT